MSEEDIKTLYDTSSDKFVKVVVSESLEEVKKEAVTEVEI